MDIIWWFVPAMSGLVGLVLCFAGLGKLLKLKAIGGLIRLVFGLTILGIASFATLSGLNLLTYKAFAFDQPVAEIQFASTNSPDTFIASLTYPDGQTEQFELRGDEWNLNARIVTFRSFSSQTGYDKVYRLERLYGRFRAVDRSGETNGVKLSTDPGFAFFDYAIANGGRFGVQDEMYGSAVYNQLTDGLSFNVTMAQSGLIVRPSSDASEQNLNDEPTLDQASAGQPGAETEEN